MAYVEAAFLYDIFSSTNDLDFYKEVITEGPALELGFGTGRIGFALAEAGLEVWGLEDSPEMIKEAERKRIKYDQKVQDTVHIKRGDMSDFDLDRQFNSIYFSAGTFAHLLDQEDKLGTLNCVYNHLTEDGLLLIDLYTLDLDFLKGSYSVGSLHDLDDGRQVMRNIHTSCDLNQQQVMYTFFYEIYQDNCMVERIVEKSPASIIFPDEIKLLLKLTDFQIEKIYGGTDLSDFDSTSSRMIVIARKK